MSLTPCGRVYVLYGREWGACLRHNTHLASAAARVHALRAINYIEDCDATARESNGEGAGFGYHSAASHLVPPFVHPLG